MADSPAVVGPYSSESVEIGVKDGVAAIVNQRGWIGVGYDGANYRFISTDSSGRQVVVGAGTAGTPAGGVVSVQGVSGGQALPISAASLPLPSGAATEATLATLLTESTFTTRVPVLVTGGGTEATALRVTIANDSTGVLSVDDNGGSLTTDTTQLPAALVGGRLDTNVGAWLGATTPTVGQKAMTASIPVVIASDQSAVSVAQSGTWTVQQGTPPWAVKGTDADGAAPTQNPVLVAGHDGTNVQTKLTDTAGRQRVVGAGADGAAAVGDPVQVAGVDGSGNTQSVRTETDGSVRTRDDFIDDRDKIVGLSFYKEGVAATTYYMGIDLSNTTDFKHAAGTGIRLVTSIGKAIKSNIGAKWAVQLLVVLRIDGTDSDLAVLAQASVSLQDTSALSRLEQVVDLWPHVANLSVSGGALTSILTNLIETGVTAINTGVTLEDAAGNTPTPAVGDLLIRADLISGSGTLDFAYGLHYWVE